MTFENTAESIAILRSSAWPVALSADPIQLIAAHEHCPRT